MPTTDENKAIRTQQSREVARDAAEAYRAAKRELLDAMEANRAALIALDLEPLRKVDYAIRWSALREESRQLTLDARDLGLERSLTAHKLGVSRETIHNWLNGKKW